MTGQIKSWSRDPETGSNQNYKSPLACKKTSFAAVKMPATHHRDICLGTLVFIEFNILICILMERQRRTHLNPRSSPAIQPPPQPPPQSVPRRRRKPPCPGSFKDKNRDSTATSWQTSYRHPRIPEFCQDASCLFDLIKECIHHHINKSVTNFRMPLEV